jgi:hypothetical protein
MDCDGRAMNAGHDGLAILIDAHDFFRVLPSEPDARFGHSKTGAFSARARLDIE